MSHDDFAAEPINGLPELPPRGEVILWQGRPNWFRLTVESLNPVSYTHLTLPTICSV